MWWIVGVVAAVVLIATYVTFTAGRVDRLHARAAAAGSALDAHLVRRAAAATHLADALDRADLRRTARAALEAFPDEREVAENDLTRALRDIGPHRPSPISAALDGAPAHPTMVDGAEVAEVMAISRRVALSRQVHNDLVRDALAIRRRPLVRLLGLARRHPEPHYFDVDNPILDDAGTG